MMSRIVRGIMFLLFTIALYSGVNGFSAHSVERDLHVITACPTAQHCCLTSADLPYFPDAELLGGALTMHHVAMSRLQRIQLVECSLLLKELLRSMANREAALSLHQEKIYNTTTSYYCQPSSQYYVFALRRIII